MQYIPTTRQHDAQIGLHISGGSRQILIVALILCAAFVTGCTEPENSESVGWEPPTILLDILHDENTARISEGDVAVLDDGTLMFVYQKSGVGGSDFDRMDLVVQYSKDNGATWSADSVLVSADEATQNVMCPSLIKTSPDGTWLFFYLAKEAYNDTEVRMRRSTDGKSWSQYKEVTTLTGYHVVNNARIVQSSSGRIFVPTAYHPEDGDQEWSDKRAFGIPRVYYSDDDGETWLVSDPWATNPTPGIKLQEPGIIERKDGSLLMWMRTSAGTQYESYSLDDGKTWTIPAPGPLTSPLSPATIIRLPWNDKMAVVWNDHRGGHPHPEQEQGFWAGAYRTPLAIAVSSDEGKTWSESLVLEHQDEFNFSYPSITPAGDQLIITYSMCEFGVGCDQRVISLPRTVVDSLP